MSGSARFMSFIALIAVAIVVSGCTSNDPIFVDSGKAVDEAGALVILAQADASAFATRPTLDGPALRHNALAALRRKYPSGSGVADLLTRTFPSDTSGVPVYVERATYDGTPAIIVVEATGPGSGELSSKRLWVVGMDGTILFAGSR